MPEPEPTPVADPERGAVVGDFNGDGRDDAAMFYGYRDDSIELFTSLANASGGFGGVLRQLQAAGEFVEVGFVPDDRG